MAKIIRQTLVSGKSFVANLKNYGKLNYCIACAHKQETAQRDNELKRNEVALVENLRMLFNIRQYNALSLLNDSKKLKMVTKRNRIKDNYKICKDNRLNDVTILKNVDVLAEEDLEKKFELIRKIPFDVNITAPFLLLSYNNLEKLTDRLIQEDLDIRGGRISFFSNLFQTSEEFICSTLVTKPFLQNVDVNKVQSVYRMLLSANVAKDDIIKDLWVFRYSCDHIRSRIEFAKENNVDEIKTWMVRATPEIFQRYLKRRSDKKSILGDNSLVEYLSKRLQCKSETVKEILEKQPALKNKSVIKMQEIIDFLFQEGFTPSHIIRIPKILLHSVETIGKRIKELEKVRGTQLNSLHILTKSQKQYQQFYESMLKNKEKS